MSEPITKVRLLHAPTCPTAWSVICASISDPDSPIDAPVTRTDAADVLQRPVGWATQAVAATTLLSNVISIK